MSLVLFIAFNYVVFFWLFNRVVERENRSSQ